MAPVPFDWQEYLRLAQNLSTNTDEASKRTSISRAYYFVFHLASKRAIDNGYPPGTANHQGLWAHYQKDMSSRDARQLATLGTTMKNVRVLADYKAVVPSLQDQMEQQLRDAADFLLKLNALPPGSPPP